MQIQSINNQHIAQTNKNNSKNNSYTTSFKGFRGSGRALFVGDIDGTVEVGAQTYLAPFLNLLKQCRAHLVFASGRSLEKFGEIQANFAKSNVDFPTPEFLITQNGAHIYKNTNGKLVEDQEWSDRLSQSFNREKVMASVKELAFQPEYLMPGVKYTGKEDFSKSKLCSFEFWPTPRRLQFIADESISDTIFRTIKDKLKADGISARVLRQFFTKEECDRVCNPEQLGIVNPRYGNKDFITQIDITAANKGDGVEFVRNKLGVSDYAMAGNDANDISMAKLTLDSQGKSPIFIGVGNRTKPLETYMINLINENPTLANSLMLPKQEGLAGIIEAINKVRTNKGKN